MYTGQNAINAIEVIKGAKGFTVYGRFGAVMHADANKQVTYSNMTDESNEYRKMFKALNKA